MRIFSKHLSITGAAAFAAALGISVSPGTPRHEIAGFTKVPGVEERWLDPKSDYMKFVTRAVKIVKNEDLRPKNGIIDRYVDESTVFLMNLRGESVVSVGTGTVIRSQTGENRVLTAQHVSDREDVKIIAFSKSGRAIAELVPTRPPADVWTRDVRKKTLSTLEAAESSKILANDISVLKVSELLGTETSMTWQGRGVEISPVQPSQFLVLAVEKNDTSFSSGMSGASMRNSFGEVVGVVTMSTYDKDSSRPDTPLPEPSEFINLLSSESEDAVFKSEMNRISQAGRENHLSNAVSFGIPVISPTILSDLGVKDVMVRQDIGAFRVEVQGFPGGNPSHTQAFASPVAKTNILDYVSGPPDEDENLTP